MKSPSIERAVVRSHVGSIVGTAFAIVCVSAIVTTAVVVDRDDGQALALVRTLGSELENHRDDPPSTFDDLVDHELEEQKWFRRTIEVWRDNARIGGARTPSRLRPWIDQGSKCALRDVSGVWSRVCVERMDPKTTILVASSIGPLLSAQVPLVVAVALAATMAALVFSISAKRLVHRRLRPLRDFEDAIATLPALDRDRVRSAWGASEIDQLARTFNALLERIDAAVAREQRFVSNAAHELRTPLTRLRGQIELTMQDVPEASESSMRLSLAARSCEDLGRSIDALLALSHDEVDRSEAVNLGDLATDVVGALTAEEARRVRMSVVQANVRGNAALLSLALRNLVDNALKYSEGSLELRIDATDVSCMVSVSDEGPGIPDSELTRVREPFVRGRPETRGSVRGSGLGLSLVDHVAKLHDGELLLENRSPRGLRALVTMPSWR